MGLQATMLEWYPKVYWWPKMSGRFFLTESRKAAGKIASAGDDGIKLISMKARAPQKAKEIPRFRHTAQDWTEIRGEKIQIRPEAKVQGDCSVFGRARSFLHLASHTSPSFGLCEFAGNVSRRHVRDVRLA